MVSDAGDSVTNSSATVFLNTNVCVNVGRAIRMGSCLTFYLDANNSSGCWIRFNKGHDLG